MDFNVSVIIPVYNASKFLKQCVESVIGLEEVKEILLIDDGSTDGSFELCTALTKQYPKIKLFTHPKNENKGPSFARNIGIRHAKENYIAYLDSDDLFLPNRFEETKNIFSSQDIDGVYESIGTIVKGDDIAKKYYSSGYPEITQITKDDIKPENLFESMVTMEIGWFSLDGLTLKRSSLINSGLFFDEKLRQGEDTDFIYRLAMKLKLRSGKINSVVANRIIHGENSIFNSRVKNENKILFSQKWFQILEQGKFNKQIYRNFIKGYLSIGMDYSKSSFYIKIKLAIKLVILSILRPSLIYKSF